METQAPGPVIRRQTRFLFEGPKKSLGFGELAPYFREKGRTAPTLFQDQPVRTRMKLRQQELLAYRGKGFKIRQHRDMERGVAKIFGAGTDTIRVEGVERLFGTDYRVHILPGLRGNDGAELAQALAREVSVGDRSPSLWFQNSLYVLPRGGGGVPLHSVNLEQAELAIYRVDERNLQQEFVRNKFHADIDRWEAESLRDRIGEQVWSGQVELALRRNQEALTQLTRAATRIAEPLPKL